MTAKKAYLKKKVNTYCLHIRIAIDFIHTCTIPHYDHLYDLLLLESSLLKEKIDISSLFVDSR